MEVEIQLSKLCVLDRNQELGVIEERAGETEERRPVGEEEVGICFVCVFWVLGP